MTTTDGRALVASYLKQLRVERGVEQDAIADRLGVHKNTVFRSELISGAQSSSKLETAIAIAKVLGGDVGHVVALRAERIPDDYPRDRMEGDAVTVEVAADIAKWYVEEQDRKLSEAASKQGAPISGTKALISALQWEAFRDPGRVLRGFL